jgi:uncharacterized protein (TIGR03435 family)
MIVGWRRRRNTVRLLLTTILAPLFALALLLQLPVSAQHSRPADFRFEVLSIRPVDTAPGTPGQRMGATDPGPSGFESMLSVYQMIMVAYGPANSSTWSSVRLLKIPDWNGDFYRIAAKVPQADLSAWQHQGPERELLRAAMRAALRERCKLAIHEQPSKGDVFELVAAKGGARLKPTAPANDPRPPGPTETKFRGGGITVKTLGNGRRVATYYVDLPGGGVLVQTRENGGQTNENGEQVYTYYNATTNDIAEALAKLARIPVRDKTGLTGRYDFTVKFVPPEPGANHVYCYQIGRLGLAVKRGTEMRPVLVIDHIERPSPN